MVTPIGFSMSAEEGDHVCIPDGVRLQHVHLIGQCGCGKSALMERMVLSDIEQGHGVAVLDPRGGLVMRLLGLMPPGHAERVIYANPGDPEHVLLWNPLTLATHDGAYGIDRGRIVDGVVGALGGLTASFGDRMEHLLRHGIAAAMLLPKGTLQNAADLLGWHSSTGKILRQKILKLIDNDFQRHFWEDDFNRYSRSDLRLPQLVFGKLLAVAPVRNMFSQPESALDLREVMDGGKILLADLSNIGTKTRDILGCFILSLFHLTALRRDASRSPCRPFHIYCDDAYHFMTDAFEDLIAEARRSGVSLTLSHQHMSQFSTRYTDALSSVGATVVFRVNQKDALHLQKHLQGKVEPDDLITLGVGHAIARIGNRVVRLRTPAPPLIPAKNCAAAIIQDSHCRYYRCSPVDASAIS